MSNQSKIPLALLCAIISLCCIWAVFADKKGSPTNIDSLIQSNQLKIADNIEKAIALNETALKQKHPDSVRIYKDIALLNSQLENAEQAMYYARKYIGATTDLSFLNDHVFENIKDTDQYQELKQKYSAKFSGWSILYLYTGFLGIFIFIVLNLKRNIDKIGVLLISSFVLFHSLFILHLTLYIINFQYHLPHTLFISTTFSFLYGPLLYFYFKRVTYNYKFRWIDTLHLIPSILLLIYILPYYLMPVTDKFNVMFDQSNFLLPGARTIIIVKIISLMVYATLTIRIYKANIEKVRKDNRNKVLWQRNIITIFVSYIIAYLIYAAIITGIIDYTPLINLQILVMTCLVFYVAYISYVQPEIFKGHIVLTNPANIFKYKKSGLTPSYSLELKEELLALFHREKIYKQNDISLDTLSKMLGTTRHSTSQVINEHFKMNFFELINSYRIKEAIDILKNDVHGNLHIIDIAYEVGYNNKVTFNKAFKKETSLTPTEYLERQLMRA